MARAPAFWWRDKPDWRAALLSPFGVIYGLIAGHRLTKAGTKPTLTTLCVGNFIAGGAGKTPTALLLCDMLQLMGHHPVFLSRGFGGTETGPLKVGDHHTAAQIGDEPLLLREKAPTIVSTDRVAGAKTCAKHGDIIIMDDGFQNPTLKKDLNIVVVDATTGTGNGLCLPAGPLRAPLAQQFAMADLLILVKNEGEKTHPSVQKLPAHLPQFSATATIVPADTDAPFIAYCGIGRPEKFFNALRHKKYNLVDTVSFADHHSLSDIQAHQLIEQAKSTNAKLITTTKDKMRLKGAKTASLKKLDDLSMPIALDFNLENGDELKKILIQALAQRP